MDIIPHILHIMFVIVSFFAFLCGKHTITRLWILCSVVWSINAWLCLG